MTAERYASSGPPESGQGQRPIVETAGLSRQFAMPGGVVPAVSDVTIRIPRGQLVVIRGRSGSGKTTLLSMIGGLEGPTSGTVWVDGDAVSDMPESRLIRLRRRKVGFVFQSFGLMPILSAAENVEVPLRLLGTEAAARDSRVYHLLDLVGLAGRERHRPHELSGGEQQRVAIARSLASHPELLLADEPTGQLDSQTGRDVMELLRHLVQHEGLSAIVATHDPMLIELADRVIELQDGRVTGDTRRNFGVRMTVC